MYKIILKKIIFSLILLLFLWKTYALNTIWDFSTNTEYILSNSNTTEVSSWLGQLKMQLSHNWLITNWWTTLLDNPESIVIDWNYAYIASAVSDAIEIINISNPNNPTHVANIVNWAWWARLDDPRAIIKSWNYLYVAVNRSDSIEIIDVSTPSTPSHVAYIRDSWTTYLNWTRWLTIVWNYLYATSYSDDALEIIDISNPSNPTHVWSIRNTTRLDWAHWVAVSWNYAYVTSNRNDSMQVIDISNPSNPSLVWEITDWTALLNWAREIKIIWNYAYITSTVSDALEIIDISIPSAPNHLSNIIEWWNLELNWARWLFIEWDYAYIASHNDDWIQVINISDPSNPTQVTQITDWWIMELNWATTLQKVWNYLYIWWRVDDWIEILKISYDSTSPNIIPSNELTYSWSIDKITTILWTTNQGSIKYQISKNDWTSWYYLSWTTRTITTSWVSNSNTASQINSEIQSFNWLAWWTWKFKWRSFLIWDWTERCEIDKIKVDYTSNWINEIIDFEVPWGYIVTEWIWARQTFEQYEWSYALKANNWWVDNSSSCFEITRDIYSDSKIEFQRKVSSESWYDYLRFYIDSVQQSEWAWNISRWTWSYNVWNWNHTFRWCYEKDSSVSNWDDTARIDYIEIKEIPPITEITVLDFETASWYTVTSNVTTPWPDWQRVTTEKYEWSYSLESQNRTDNTNVCFERIQTVWATDTGISFYKKVSSESWYDYLIFSINGTEQDRWSGEIAWSKEVYTLAIATYTLRWCYFKDWSVSNWDDRAWIDLVTVTQDPPIITEVTPIQTPTNDNTPDYTFNTPIAWNISYSWSCTSSTNTWAIIWDNTITFDTLADWIYTDCTIQVLANPENTTILNVTNFTIDTTWIDITINEPEDSTTIQNWDFELDVSYYDNESWVNTWSIVIQMFKWNWSSYWTNIANTYIDFAWANITESWAIYNITNPWWWEQYKIVFSIEDNTWNNWIATSVFDIANWDTTPPTIINNFPWSWNLLPNSNFDINFNYSDNSWVNTWSIILELKKWNWINWWSDIATNYVSFTWATITSTWVIYPTSKLWYWKYNLNFKIEDTVWNTWTLDTPFYIDEPELIINTWSLDIGNLKAWDSKFSNNEFIITIKTVWAWFDLILNKQSPLINWVIEIIDWNTSEWFWYEKSPYINTINSINVNQTIATQTRNININWNKNSYIYSLKLGALIWKEQIAWNYSWALKFWLNLNY